MCIYTAVLVSAGFFFHYQLIRVINSMKRIAILLSYSKLQLVNDESVLYLALKPARVAQILKMIYFVIKGILIMSFM